MIDRDCLVPHKWLQHWVDKIILPTCASYGLKVLWVKYCPSERKGLHFRIKLNPAISALLTLELQYLLSDDAKRVSLNRARMRAGFDDWNKLFEKEHFRLRTLYRHDQRPQIENTNTLDRC